MAANAFRKDVFFDVLIDQIVDDVRREYSASGSGTGVAHENESTSGVRRTPDDLVSRLLDFRTRQEAPRAELMKRFARPGKSSPSRDLTKSELLLGAPADSRAAAPTFAEAETQIAFEVISKAGAKFYVGDISRGRIHPEAFKRERRRVLLNLHPDRHPESARAEAHKAFLTAAEAFSTLGERAILDLESAA